MRSDRSVLSSPWGILACCITVAAAALLAYAHVLGYFFNDRDSLALVEASRIRDFGDLVRILTTSPASLTLPFDIYRPLSVLSYSLDYSIWGLDPFGYHLTDILLHLIVSLLVFAVAYSITRGDRPVALLGALLFTLHPINVEVVPSPERRHDVMAALFFLLSFIMFTGEGGRTRRVLALLCYGLALCSKEVAVVLPLVVWAYFAVFPVGVHRLRRAFTKSAPLFFLAASYALWRVIGPGASAYSESSAAVMCREWMRLISSYFTELVYPVDFVSLLPRPLAAVLLWAAGTLVVALFWITCWRSAPLLKRFGRKGRAAALLLLAVSLLSLSGLLSYPLTGALVARAVGGAYRGDALPLIGGDMEGRDVMPLEFYTQMVDVLVVGVLSFVFVASWIVFLLVANAGRVREAVNRSRTAGLLMFLGLWLLIFFLFYFAAARFELRYLYLPSVPFSIALSVGLVASVRSMARGVRPARGAACFIPSAAVAVSLVAFSPLFWAYAGWRESGEVASMFCHRLLELLPGIPEDGVLYVRGFPGGISSHGETVPGARSVSYVADDSVRSWLDLNDPKNEREVILVDQVVLDEPPRGLRLELRRGADPGAFVITVVTDPGAGASR